MTQSTWRNIDPAVDDGVALSTLLNNIIPALMSTQEGAAPPAGATKGAIFVDSSGEAAGGNFVIKFFDGAGWHVLMTINKASGSVTLPTPPPADLPAGTRLLFQQTAAPTGWTKDTSQNNKALRVTSGGVVTGGTVPFTDAFKVQAMTGTVQDHVLTVGQMPNHGHQSQSGNVAYANASTLFIYPKGDDPSVGNYIGYGNVWVDAVGGNQPHNHGFTGTNVDLTVQFVDVIIAQKN